jgi:uncharacterized LabA/DUF88 family protein
VIDWAKLYSYLKDRWKCEKVFFYAGIEIGDSNTEEEYKRLGKLGYEMRTKTTMSYKRKDKTVNILCSNCGQENTKSISMGYDKKSNCDSELTVDVLELAQPETELLIFTGDGDFTYLIKKLIESGVSVRLISSKARPSPSAPRRFSYKLTEMLCNKEVDLIEINSWKEKIKKVIETSI